VWSQLGHALPCIGSDIVTAVTMCGEAG
jgi:hypothetical protein